MHETPLQMMRQEKELNKTGSTCVTL